MKFWQNGGRRVSVVSPGLKMSELLFKVIIIGDATVGKTSFVQRYVNNHPRREYKPTVGGRKTNV